MSGRICESAGCGKPAGMQCPTCVELMLAPSYFCEQSCFKQNWAGHKLKHAPQQPTSEAGGTYNPFPNFDYTGSCWLCDVLVVVSTRDGTTALMFMHSGFFTLCRYLSVSYSFSYWKEC